MLTRIDHVGIACRDLAAKVAFYESTFGLTVVSLETNEEQGVKEAMLAVADGARPACPTCSCSSRSALIPRSAGSSSGAARACITSATASPTSSAAMAAMGAAGLRLLDSQAPARLDGRVDRVPAPGAMSAAC